MVLIILNRIILRINQVMNVKLMVSNQYVLALSIIIFSHLMLVINGSQTCQVTFPWTFFFKQCGLGSCISLFMRNIPSAASLQRDDRLGPGIH